MPRVEYPQVIIEEDVVELGEEECEIVHSDYDEEEREYDQDRERGQITSRKNARVLDFDPRCITAVFQ